MEARTRPRTARRLRTSVDCVRVFLTHNSEDRDAYYGRALPRLAQIADVVQNPFDHDLSTEALIDAARECDVIIAHRSTAGEAALFGQSAPGVNPSERAIVR